LLPAAPASDDAFARRLLWLDVRFSSDELHADPKRIPTTAIASHCFEMRTRPLPIEIAKFSSLSEPHAASRMPAFGQFWGGWLTPAGRYRRCDHGYGHSAR
jgi:hypothetical protein